MPSLNPNEEKITKALGSILANTGDFEVVVVFQNTDHAKISRICNCYPSDKRLKILISDEVGISLARNLGIRASKGRWILLLDDDVYIEPNTITSLSNCLDENIDMYYGNAKIIDTDEFYVKYYIAGKDLDFWSYNRVCSIALIINKSVFDNLGFFDERLGSGTYFGSSEESDLVLRVLLENKRIKYISCYNVFHERATHSLSKVERYARGSGALYKKFMFGNIRNYKINVKFLLDFVLRLFFLLTFKKKRYVFLKGFFDGFFKFPR
ncbi:glycosyltransferase [Vibrio coralliilyticus]|nr:glycosyltransferase [Vibrio coralliilyticus]